MRIGVDVGGTNTDAVLMNGNQVVAKVKSPTTERVEDGIIAALSLILAEAGIEAPAVTAVSIGTTHFTNAFVQRKRLDRVGAIRIAKPAAQALPPYSDWPDDICTALGNHAVSVRGGYHYDGRVNSELDEAAIAAAARTYRNEGINAIALSALFAPINDDMEIRAHEIIKQEHPDAAVTLSSKIGRIGLLERENAGLMNASLTTLATETVTGFEKALAKLGITAPFFVSQNDGTLMNAGTVKAYPVLTFASGPTNSMRGAAFLAGLEDAMVADIGGTTTDIGVLRAGFPRESSIQVDIGGVRTNFRMPDVTALGLGGGSIVRQNADGRVSIGPDSVGFELAQKAMVFGGDTITTTDIAVAAGYAEIGDPGRVKSLDRALVDASVNEIHRLVEDGIDRMKTSGDGTPLILVGGGAILINRDLKGVSETLVQEQAGVANAIGASIAQVGGEVDKVFAYDEIGRETAIERATSEAKREAIAAGAIPDSVEIMDMDEVPLACIPGGAVRLRVKVAGDLSHSKGAV
ncbi:MAG: hydantoinase/oxoprolinase N-terminal domain-containing protein [Henriciella sp.]